MKAPQLKYVSLSQLKPSKHNPPGRQKRDIRSLAKSIQEIGLQYPILISENNVIIDGHRRVAAHRDMGLETIPCIVSMHADPNAVYAGVNSNSRRVTGNDALAVYLVEPTAVSARTRHNFEEMEQRLGRALCRDIQKHGKTYTVYRMAREICKACDLDDNEQIQKTVVWFLTRESPAYVKSLFNTKTLSPATILRAVKANRPLRVKVG